MPNRWAFENAAVSSNLEGASCMCVPGQLQLEHGLAEAHDSSGLVASNAQPLAPQLQEVAEPLCQNRLRLPRW